MKVLLDTCVISEIRRSNAEPRVTAAVQSLGEGDAFLSAITIGEISFGLRRLERGKRQRELMEWLRGLERDFADRILGIDGQIARLWGEIRADAQRAGREVAMTDGLIAATARHHGLQVMTRNVDDFTPTGIQIVNPWP